MIKVGVDEVIFKMYNENSSAWTIDKKEKLRRKTESKGNMKIVFKDEVFGLGYNTLPEEIWTAFQEDRPRRKIATTSEGKTEMQCHFLRPSLVHWEYGKEDETDEDGNKLKGYWTAEDNLILQEEFMDLFDFLYGEEGCGTSHGMLENMDWSSKCC